MTQRISCSQCRPLLPASVAGSLAEQEREAVDRHVITCAACRQTLADWREVSGATHYTHEVLQPPPLARVMIWQSVQAAITNGTAVQDPPDPRERGLRAIDLGELPPPPATPHPLPPRRRPPPIAWLAPVATLLVAVFALVGLLTFAAHPPPPANGRIYVTTFTDVQSTTEGELEALDAANGALLWRTGVLQNPSTPIVAGNVVLLTTTTPFSSPAIAPSAVLAFNATTGVQLWHRAAGTLSMPPMVTGNVVLLAFTGTSSNGQTQSATLEALDLHSGRVLWQDAMPGQISAMQPQGDRVIVTRAGSFCQGSPCNAPDQILAVALADGHMLWQPVSIGVTPVTLVPASSGGLMLALMPEAISSGQYFTRWTLTAIDPQTGQVRWHQQVAATGSSGTVQAIAGVAVSTIPQADGSEALVAVQESTGAILWQTSLAGTISPVYLQDGAAVVGSETASDTTTQAFDLQTGHPLWNAAAWPLFATSGRMMLRESGTGAGWNLVARDTATGRVAWSAPLDNQPVQVMPEGSLFLVVARPIGSGDIFQSIIAIQAHTGAARWNQLIIPGFIGLAAAP